MSHTPLVCVSDLVSDYGVPQEQIVEWIRAGHLKGHQGSSGYWYVSLPYLITFHALRAGKSPEEAKAEQEEAFKHTRVRFLHTPVGTEVTDEELERHRG